MELVKKNKHIKIILAGHSPSGTTNNYVISNNSTGQVLGTISWFSSWRQYCFDPSRGTVWSSSCLDLVIELVKEINEAHKN